MSVGGTWNQRLLERYRLDGVCRDPMTMMAVGLGASAVGTGISAVGSLSSGQAQKEAAGLTAQTELTSSRMAADAAIGGATLTASAARTSAAIASTAALNSSELTARAQEEGGELAGEEADFEAAQLRQNATLARVQAQRSAFDIQQQTRLALSTLRARAAGSGLNAKGGTPVAIASQIGARGGYLALSEMAAGENAARGIEDEATAKTFEGQVARYGGTVTAAGTRYAGTSTSEADLFQGESTARAAEYEGSATASADLYAGSAKAKAALMGGEAAVTASEFSAAGTLASGVGSALTKYGMIKYQTTAGRSGVTT